MSYQACERCGTTEVPRKAHGLCRNCYMQDYRAKRKNRGDLEEFVAALPALFRQVGIMGYTARYEDGQVTIQKLGSRMRVSWP